MDDIRKQLDDLKNKYYQTEKLVSELVCVIDALESDLSADSALEMMVCALGKAGVEPISPENEPYDPEFHQLARFQPSSEHEPHTVIRVIQKGYKFNGRLVRPAMVIVSK